MDGGREGLGEGWKKEGEGGRVGVGRGGEGGREQGRRLGTSSPARAATATVMVTIAVG